MDRLGKVFGVSPLREWLSLGKSLANWPYDRCTEGPQALQLLCIDQDQALRGFHALPA